MTGSIAEQPIGLTVSPGWCHQTQVAIRGRSGDPAARRALQIALLDQIRLDHILDGAGLLTNARRNIVQPNGPPSNR